ncbi:DUF1287 domain-containing protein [Candidatus Sumerlaeota bacterium]|nr:DUF1287 domain-containing protein [Candidatus Sumerlaeota bacterium]
MSRTLNERADPRLTPSESLRLDRDGRLSRLLAIVLGSIAIFLSPFPPRVDAKPDEVEQNLATRILAGARKEASKKTPYIMEYHVIAYPMGDVPEGTGVCTDLVIRAFRNAGIDLQQLLHEDRKAHPEAYPTDIWENKKPDKNIDHRRCQNLAVWFKRFTEAHPTDMRPEKLNDWQGGDVVFFVRKGDKHPWHVAIVSDAHDSDGIPLLIDSFPPRTSESHRLDEFGPIHSHFRAKSLPKPKVNKD